MAIAPPGRATGVLAAAAYLIGRLVESLAAHAAVIPGALTALLKALGDGGSRHCPVC